MNSECSAGDLLTKPFPFCLSPGAQSFTQLQRKNIHFPWYTEKREEEYSSGIGAEEWTPEIPCCFTPCPMGVEIWLHLCTGDSTACTKPPRVCWCRCLEGLGCSTARSRKPHCRGGTVGERSQDRSCSHLSNTAAGAGAFCCLQCRQHLVEGHGKG